MSSSEDLGVDHRRRAIRIIHVLREATRQMVEPASATIVARYGRDPFLILIACLLSLRAKDTASLPASMLLFEHARTPAAMKALPLERIEKLIYSVGYYRRKAITIHAVCDALLRQFDGVVPNAEAELLSLPGVGRKTANLVLGEAFGVPALCVDIHVHRISNRLGLVSTKTPAETELVLQKILPKEYWIEYNSLLVMWGQNICVPLSPRCSQCPLAQTLCPRVSVTRSR
ncbi:endonuclease III [Candidatus Dependentiae bacterium]|nr:endonuclease III [Candidatus Dependentiae bacterium]MCC7414635.1 endonuclease III [Campylobacterota bacterium]